MSPLLLLVTLFTLALTLSSYLTLTCAQCPAQSRIFNDTSLITPSTYKSLFLNQTLAERPQSGKVKDGLIAAIGNALQCQQITIMGMRGEFGDGWTWGSVVDFVIPASVVSDYESSVVAPRPSNRASDSLRTSLGVATLIAIPTSTLSNYLINGQVVRNRQSGINVIGTTGSQSQIAAQPCETSEWDQCDGCKKDKIQIVSRRVTKPAVGGGSCPALQMRMYCDRKCLTDWQIGLIALACFLFLVACCICCYCMYRRRHHDTGRERAAAKQRELETPAAVVDEKIDVDVVDPVRPSTADEGNTNFHRDSQDTVTTGPRPTATFHDDEPDETDTKPVPEEKEETVTPAPVPAAVAGAPRANVVRVHL